MNYLKIFTVFCLLKLPFASAAEFTISSYNCGGLSNHYDYLRAACMETLMQERYAAEPELMALNEKVQSIALKLLFSEDSADKMLVLHEWDVKGYEELSKKITATPGETDSINRIWNEKAEKMITSYRVRPVTLYDKKVNRMLDEHLGDFSQSGNREKQLQKARSVMASRIFANHLNYDIMCLQEADYLNSSQFPANYEVLFAETSHSKNGIAWNKERFELVKSIGNILGKAFAAMFRDKETGKTVLIASGHITGCNPFHAEKDPITGLSDSAKGDSEIQAIVDLFDGQEADLMIIGMDSNVTALHPRLSILKNAGYRIDADHFLEPTCTNPYQALNTRIDWIALKSHVEGACITNIPVLSIGLNNIETNISDHKPIAAKISY